MELLYILIVLGNFFFGGFVYMQLWNWFPASIFGLPLIGYAAGLGLVVFSAVLKYKNFDVEGKKEIELNIKESLALTFCYCWALGVGFLISTHV